MVELSDRTKRIIERMFPAADWRRAGGLLESGCAENLPLVREHNPTPQSLERLRFAVIKLSGGSINKLRETLVIAQHDWRDVLMAAGFGHSLEEHNRWAETILLPPQLAE